MRLVSPNLRRAAAAAASGGGRNRRSPLPPPLAAATNALLAAALRKNSSSCSLIHGRLSFNHTTNHRAERTGWAVRVLPPARDRRPRRHAHAPGACGSCPSSTMTLKMGIETCLRDKIPEILEVKQILDTETGLELNLENVEKVLDEIRPYLSGTGGGGLELVQIDGFVIKIRISGPAAGVMTVRVAVTQN